MEMENFKPFIEGKNVYFIPMVDEASDKYLTWVNNPDIVEFLETGPFPKSKNKLNQYLKNVNDNPNYVFFAIMEKESKQYIGNAKLGPIDWISRTTGYGRMIGEKQYQSKGYGTEVLNLLVNYAFNTLNLNKIYGGIIDGNIASVKSNTKAGFEIEGKRKEQVFHKGKFKDVILIGLTKKKYLQLKKVESE